MPKSSAGQYYWRWFVQVGRQVRLDVRELIVGLIIALAILVLQAHKGTVGITSFRANAFSILWPYLVAIGLYLSYAFLRAPFDLDSERAQRIEGLLSTIPTPVSVVFERVDVTIYNGRERPSVIVLHLSIRTGEEPATLDDWMLLKLGEPVIRFPPTGLYVGQPSNTWRLRLQAHDRAGGNIGFSLAQLGSPTEAEIRASEWQLEFSDAHETRIVSIPPDLLSISRVGAR